ncbi:MAG TPA: hypothetical protein VEB59_15150 [Gemmatimonadales bacterium]|nr:hypothetical protein [Gemmatimonadales bacterium]
MPNRALTVVLFALLLGCDERERLTFPTDEPGSDEEGPITTIEVPSIDSMLTEGDPFVAGGRAVDPAGIDTVYFEVFGTGQAFLPQPGGGAETVSFGLPIPTIGLSGTTVIVRVRAVDRLGNQGTAAVRLISIE